MPIVLMEPSNECILFMKAEEGCARWDETVGLYMPYPDSGGLATIGRGHRLTHIDIGSGVFKYGLSTSGCDLLFMQDLKPTVAFVNSIIHTWTVFATQGQFDCLTDFSFNAGMGTCKALLLAGIQSIPANLMHYVHDAKGNVEPGLVRRRQQDVAWWTGTSVQSNAQRV